MGCMGGSKVLHFSPTHILSRMLVQEGAPHGLLLHLFCGMDPCQTQQLTRQVKPNQKMCPRTPSAFVLAVTQSMG